MTQLHGPRSHRRPRFSEARLANRTTRARNAEHSHATERDRSLDDLAEVADPEMHLVRRLGIVAIDVVDLDL